MTTLDLCRRMDHIHGDMDPSDSQPLCEVISHAQGGYKSHV